MAFLATGLEVWLSSQEFTHMLRALDLIPITAQIVLKLAGISSLVEVSVVQFLGTLTIEASLPCVLITAAG